jgi:hypothetical protein
MPTSRSDRLARAASVPGRRCERRPIRAPRRCRDPRAHTPLGAYRDRHGRDRELVAAAGSGGSTLVIDRDLATLSDRRLVAHLGAEEPRENAALVCRHYLADPAGRWCRPLRMEDLVETPPGEARPPVAAEQLAGDPGDGSPPELADAAVEIAADTVVEANGMRCRLLALSGERRSRQLRWCRQRAAAAGEGNASVEGEWEQVSLREVVGALERYEPMRTITARALARDRDDDRLQLRRLRSEYERLCSSPVVLNRALREAVLRAVERDGQSLSEMALRCGVVKRDRRGRVCGETSWLARRIGLMPEGGRREPTPWVHSDVLALIARRALRVSPREVEVP